MIFHISIPAADPAAAAATLAAIVGGVALPFHPVPGARIIFYGDADGTAIEVYPDDTVLEPGQQMLAATRADAPHRVGFHAAIATPLPTDRVFELAEQAGWPVRLCSRGPFELIELWVDNRVLVEVLTPRMQTDYRRSMTPGNWERWE